MDRWIQIYTEVTGLNDEQKMTVANGIRREVGARRKDQERQPTAAQEQGKRVCFTTGEVQEAREWQERFIEKGRRGHEAREEEWKEQEKKRYEEDDDEWVPMVPNMVAGGSYLQTTDSRDVVEQIVMDELQERQTARGNDDLIRGGMYRSQTNETNGKGKGKGEGGKGEHEDKRGFGGKGQHGIKEAPANMRKLQDEQEEV